MSHSKNLSAQSETEKQEQAAAERKRRIAAANEVRREEWRRIRQRRQVAFGSHVNPSPTVEPKDDGELPHPPENLVGLSLSGGGIRSALYYDGFLQGLSHRGLLRYVDYLSTVSGGGYIGGHLISQAKDDASETISAVVGGNGHAQRTDHDSPPAFHDDESRWWLGRSPVTGEVTAKRLLGIGGYLNRPLELIPTYFWSCLMSAALYVGVAGVIATLLAMFWRSFDDPTFRRLYLDVLGLNIGNELLIAFIPAILVLMVYVVLSLAFWTSRGALYVASTRTGHRGENSPNWAARWGNALKRWQDGMRSTMFIVIGVSHLTSVAIFLGNGKTHASASGGDFIYLNHYAQTLAVAAAVVQIVVFLGRDRLFRSERQEAKNWHKKSQQWVLGTMMGLFTFAMIHWMGREDISNYTTARDSHFVTGDITNWPAFIDIFEEFWPDGSVELEVAVLGIGTNGLSPHELHPPIRPENMDSADLWWATRNFETLIWSFWEDEDGTDRPSDLWMLEPRILGVYYAYLIAVLDVGATDQSELIDTEREWNDLVVKLKDAARSRDVKEFVRLAYDGIKASEVQRRDLLVKANRSLATRDFFEWIITAGESRRAQETDGDKTLVEDAIKNRAGRLPLAERVGAFLDEFDGEVSSTVRDQIMTFARRLKFNDGDRKMTKGEQEEYAQVNRMLLELLFPNAIQKKDIPSTYVVPPYDQDARREWLGFWLFLVLVGAIGSGFRHRLNAIYFFYRRHVGDNFLRNTSTAELMADKPISQLNPTADGLPHPLILGTAMEPVTVNGNYRIDARPFVFSPVYSGELPTVDDVETQLESTGNPMWYRTNVDVKLKGDTPITLGDAVTLSGAAVSRLMTANRSLSILLDFFNTGLGRRVYFPDKVRRHRWVPWLAAIVGSGLFAALMLFCSQGHVLPTVLGFFAGLIVSACLIEEAGTPMFLKSLYFPREIGRDGDPSVQQRQKSKYVADGGFYDYLGVTALLQRECELIIVSDAGAHLGDDSLGTLARICEQASSELGVRFLDLDHEGPIDFGRLNKNESRLVHQPYMCVRIRYPRGGEGLLFYCQMAITERDPVEIQQIRNRFPSFPDEPTTNQFYTDEQVAAYRTLGYHIAGQLCRELERWDFRPQLDQVRFESRRGGRYLIARGRQIESYAAALLGTGTDSRPAAARFDGLPLFDVLLDRLLTSYRLVCHEELSYREHDIYSEAIWPSATFAFPAFIQRVQHTLANLKSQERFPATWLSTYERSADVRSAYRKAVLEDINGFSAAAGGFTETLWQQFVTAGGALAKELDVEHLLAGHLASIAIACQEIHRGRPHATFQIGGREKLLDLCHQMAGVIAEFNGEVEQRAKPSRLAEVDSPQILPATDIVDGDANRRRHRQALKETLDLIVGELNELERSVFQDGQHLATISFAQCSVAMWGRDVAKLDMQRRAFASGEELSEAQMVELRSHLDKGFRQADFTYVLKTLTQVWDWGYSSVTSRDTTAKVAIER